MTTRKNLPAKESLFGLVTDCSLLQESPRSLVKPGNLVALKRTKLVNSSKITLFMWKTSKIQEHTDIFLLSILTSGKERMNQLLKNTRMEDF